MELWMEWGGMCVMNILLGIFGCRDVDVTVCFYIWDVVLGIYK